VYSVPVKKTDTFTGSDQGAENLAMIASLIETCKLHDINPQAYLTHVLIRLVNNWPNGRLGELLPSGPPQHPDPSSANRDGAEAPLTSETQLSRKFGAGPEGRPGMTGALRWSQNRVLPDRRASSCKLSLE
jgi:IS66 C-terminal element